jgi:Mrp family chromosome partitioning ATPase
MNHDAGPLPNGQRVVISVIGRKGGVGKTTTALNLAGALAEQGYAVTMIDLDPQSSLSRLADATQAPPVRDLGPQAEHRAARGGAAA